MEEIIKILEEIGFTKGESNIYLSLLRLEESKVGPIIKLSKISRSKVYDILERLIQKGLVGKVEKNGVLFFRAFEPSKILILIEEKKKKLENEATAVKKIMPTLKTISKDHEVKVSVYEGYEGFKSIIDKTIKELNKGDRYDVMGVSKTTESMRRYANRIYQEQIEKNFSTRSIFDEFGAYKILERKNPFHEIRVLPKGWRTPALFTMYKDNVGIHIGNDEKIVSILIKSEDVAQSFKTNFEAIWKISKPV